MGSEYGNFRDLAFSTLRGLAKASPIYEDAEMLVGGAETHASLVHHDLQKTVDTEWIAAIEAALPALDTVIRNPSVAIEDVDEILPVELSRHITEKSIKHLAQHTNLILDIQGDEVTPQKILNVYHDETLLTYENKFVNTLLARLSAFVDKRYRALADGSGTERAYKFDYETEFEHHPSEDGGRNSARITLCIELTSPLGAGESESDDREEQYRAAIGRIERIHRAITAYMGSNFVTRMGRNYIRPPVIRTNAILKNKNLKECLNLWEYIESFDKVGYTVRDGETVEMPSDEYIGDLHASVALQYVQFYNGVSESEANRMLSKKHLYDLSPEFESDTLEEEGDEYDINDSEYRKAVPVSRLSSNRKKLSADERRIANAIAVALRADDMLRAARRAEEEARRLAEEKAQREREEAERQEREAEERRLAEIAAARAAEEARLKKEAEEARQAEEARLAEEARKQAEEAARARAAALLAKEEENRQKAEAAAAHTRATEPFYPEDGDLTGRYPLCPFTRTQYRGMGRKKKKETKSAMDSVAAYAAAFRRLAEARRAGDTVAADAAVREADALYATLPTGERWQAIIARHRTVEE